ncbi:T9SS type A sorting domain-containing protein [Rufibacter sp. LB8]|uniref:T9SS type A sorting domain-containing protein n=1 Tax=Rufibacter sp. LB8 TaxID=2777781 RepID=UPI00178C5824|nr:T9SS type A sorting domain-containing protein [Rufibacter sp. LB8]
MLPAAAATSRDVNADISGTIPAGTTTAYYSAIIKVLDDTQLGDTPDYFMHFGNDAGAANTNLFGRLHAKKSGTGYRLAIQNISGGTPTQTDFPLDLTFGTSVLVVVKFEIKDGNDMATLWVNPTLGATEPTNGVSNSSGTNSATRFQSIGLRNGFMSASSSGTPKVEIDEIRVGTTFASVTPGTTTSIKDFKAGNLNIYPNPANGTFKLQLPANLSSGKVAMTVYTVSGTVLLSATGTEKALNEQLSSKFNNAAAGVYLVKIEANGESFQTRLVKN